jgi:uncharacterized membrane protein (DUF4010 family)
MGQPDGSADTQRMFSLRSAALVAALLTGVQAAVYALTLWLGNGGLLAATWLAALVDLHSAAAAVLAQAPTATAPTRLALMVALAVHALSKCATAWLSGGRAYAGALAPGLLVHTALAVGLLAAWAR